MFQLYAGAKGYSTGVPFDGNCNDYTGPASLIGAFGDCIQKWQGAPALPGTEYILSGRDDQIFSEKDHVFWRVRMDHGTQATSADPINPAFDAASYQPAYDGQSQWNHIFNPNVTNQFIIAGSYYRAIFDQVNAKNTFPYSVEADAYNLTTLGNSSFAFPQGRNVTQYQIIDDLSWSKGKHSFKFGENFRRYDISDFVFSEYNIPRVISLSLTDFAMGQADEYIQRFPQNGKLAQPVALWGIGLYAQDEWKVARNLKLTLGLRFEHNSNPVCQTNCAALPYQTIQNENTSITTPYNQMIQAGNHQIFRSTDAINVAPRFGFAWTPKGESTVLRGGFGMFYDALPGTMADQPMLNVPQVLSFTLLNGPYFGGPLTLNWADPTSTGTSALAANSAAALAAGFVNGASYSTLAATVPGFARPTLRDMVAFHTPAYEEWSFGVDQAIGAKTSFSVQYVGNHGYHIANYNTGLNTHIAGVEGLPVARPYASFGTVEQYSTNALANYNGLTAVFNQRMTYGFTIQASYTWSHANDEISNGGAGLYYNGVSSITTQLDPYCLRCNNYGPADYDVRHSFNASYVWNMPYKFANKGMNAVLGGWILSQNFFARSGLPYTVLDGNSQPSNGVVPPATVLSGNGQMTCETGNTQCLNPNAFGPAFVNGTYPTQRRNGYRGPMFFDSDFNVAKNFKLTERFTFQFGTNFYNVFNHPNFASPDSNIADSTFGYITATTAPPTGPYGSFFTGSPSGRIIQFQGKIIF